MENILIVLLGPTGIGKTDISVDLASRLNCEIISADSRQFYREMKIGTAVPSDEQLSEIKHHFIGFLSISDYYSSSLFERDVISLLPELFRKRNIVLMVGGSGMYIDAVCEGTDDIPDIELSVREKYQQLYMNEGIEGLRVALRIVDPEHYSKVDLRNHVRLIRALEIYETTGKPYSSFLKKQKKIRDFRIIKRGLQMNREELYNRINSRVDRMISAGLEEEAKNLFPFRKLHALNTVGYSEFFEYFDAKISREKAIELIKRNTRRYAKRQMTWWARDKSIVWFDPKDKNALLEFYQDKR